MNTVTTRLGNPISFRIGCFEAKPSLEDRNFSSVTPNGFKVVSAEHPQQKTRCQLEVNVDAPVELVLPMSYRSAEAIVFHFGGGLGAWNAFIRASSAADEWEAFGITHCGDVDAYDCLLDFLRVECRATRILRGARIAKVAIICSLMHVCGLAVWFFENLCKASRS